MKVMKFAVVLLVAVGMFSATAIAQNDCASAVSAPGGVDPCAGDLAGGPLTGPCIGFDSDYDVWVSFVASATSARIRTDVSSAGTDSNYVVWDACGGNQIGCSEDEGAGYLGDICVGGLTPGATYYVQLGAFGAGEDLSGFCGAPCNPYLFSCGVYNVDIQAATGGVCGDGVVSCVPGAEQCDDATACCNSQTCQTVPVACGNGCLETPEACDDGNLANGDGCDSNCLLEDPPVPAVSEWGLLVLVLIGLTAGTVIFGRKQVVA